MPLDSGTIEIAGRPVEFDSPAKSREAGIAVVYQDLSLVESLSVADNLMLGREPRARFGFRPAARADGQGRGVPQRARYSPGSESDSSARCLSPIAR